MSATGGTDLTALDAKPDQSETREISSRVHGQGHGGADEQRSSVQDRPPSRRGRPRLWRSGSPQRV